jgi:hypothetical protein
VPVFTTARSQYALDARAGLLLQLPGGTPCALEPGVWHEVVWPAPPRLGERFLCSVTPPGGGPAIVVRTGRVTWVGPEPPVASLADVARTFRTALASA